MIICLIFLDLLQKFCLYYNSSTCTSCNVGFYVNGISCSSCINFHLQCEQCNSLECTLCSSNYQLSGTGGCVSCTNYHSQCLACSGITCTSCAVGLYQSGTSCASCLNYHSQCLQCNSLLCTICNGIYQVSSTGGCITCIDYHSQCLTCSGSTCTSCAIGLYLSGISCASCLNYHSQCQQCSATSCTLCARGFYVSSQGGCLTCSDFHSQCQQCTGTSCNLCNIGYNLQGISCISCSSISLQCIQCNSGTCLQCRTGYYLSQNTCLTCSSAYNIECQTCDQTQCLTCLSGYTLTSGSCGISESGSIIPSPSPSPIPSPYPTPSVVIVCGDGNWIYPTQACDDGNFEINDGCDANCQVEQDYACLISDKLLTGASLCKYTKQVTVQFSYLVKQNSTNILNIFFNIKPSTFKQWNEQTIENLLIPVQIVDEQSGTATIIPYKSIQFSFYKNQTENQIKLTVKYDQYIEGDYLRFNVSPNQTGINSIQHLSNQNNLYIKLSSAKSGIGFYNYGQQIYQFTSTVNMLSSAIGLVGFGLLFLGLCFPTGKLIIIQGLAVLQITFFSILQFDKIPPSWVGFKGLLISNGYNDPNLFSSTLQTSTVYDILGIKSQILSNYNLSLMIFILLPLLVGLIGLLIVKKCLKKQNLKDQQQNKGFLLKQEDKNIQKVGKQNVWKITSKRIIFQTAFYGVLVTGYITWVSIFNSLKTFNIINIAAVVVIIGIWFVYTVLFFKVDSDKLNLQRKQQNSQSNQQNAKTIKDNKEKKDNKDFQQKQKQQSSISLMKGFADFRDVYQQISKKESAQRPASQRIYIILMLQRIVSSAIIILISSFFKISCVMIISIFSILFIGLLIMHRQHQMYKDQSEKKSLFSYLYKNYVLRQAINFIIIILIQIVFFCCQLSINNIKTTQDVLSSSTFTGKLGPVIILSLLIISLIFNIFLWIWQLINDQIITKANHVFRILCSKKQQNYVKIQEKIDQSYQNMKQTQRKGETHRKSTALQEQDFISSAMGNYISKSPIFEIKNSPFIGTKQKQSHKKAISVLKLQTQKQKIHTTSIADLTMDKQVRQKNFHQI